MGYGIMGRPVRLDANSAMEERHGVEEFAGAGTLANEACCAINSSRGPGISWRTELA